MSPPPPRSPRPASPRSPELAAGALALVLCVLHLLIAPRSGTDLAAQLARASFARQAPLTPVDLSWYEGVHPFGYSLLSPGIMAVLGVGLSGLIAAVAAAILFARLVRDLERPLLTALLGGFFSAADIVSGRTTFALGAVAVLAALLLRERRGWAIFFAVLSALLSPVSAAFLGFTAAVLVLHRRPGGWSIGIACATPVLAIDLLFPEGGIQPFSTASAVPAVIVTALLALLTSAPMVRTAAILYGIAIVVLVAHKDPFGSNVLRLGLLVAACVVLATSRRPHVLVLLAAVGMMYWQLDPLISDLSSTSGPQLSALTQELRSVGSKRVEIVAGREHRESATVAREIPLARGWARQIDYRDNGLFYRGTLTGPEYVAWLHAHAVDHVAVPRSGFAIDFGGTREATLLRQPVAGLTEVWQDADWIVYAVADPTPIVAAPAVVVSSGRTTLTLRSAVPATVHVHVRWSGWLSLKGPGCLARSGDEVSVRFRTAGTVVLGSSLLPSGHC